MPTKLLEQNVKTQDLKDPRVKSLGLRQSILSPVETLAQSIAGIAPSAAPAMTLCLVYGLAGKASWLAYLVATIAVVLTAININVFASRSASAGSLYAYAQQGAGRLLGMLCGWSMVLAYIMGVCACAEQASIFIDQAQLELFRTSLPFGVPVLCCVALSGFIAYKNIKLSAELMLWLEVASISVITVLCVLIGAKHGWAIDTSQLALHEVGTQGFRQGLVLAVLGFIGFEAAGALGEESKEPLKDIPRAIFFSTIFSGVFFIVTAYAVVYGFSSTPIALGQCSAPLAILSKQLGFPILAGFTIAGAIVSFFAACLAAVNAGARVMLAMADDRYYPRFFTGIHATNKTPQPCILFITVACAVVSLGLLASRQSVLDISAWSGTLATYALIFPYAVVSGAAPFALRREGKLQMKHIIISALSVLTMSAVFLGSFLPLPAAPYCWFPILFIVYLLAGAAWYLHCHRRDRSH
ncbi:MAG TPA: APC family permease [Planktothrix sp.]